MKDSATVERITNARLLDCVYYTYTLQVHTEGRQTHIHFVTLQAHTAQTQGPMGVGVWGWVERWVAGIDGWVVVDWMDEGI